MRGTLQEEEVEYSEVKFTPEGRGRGDAFKISFYFPLPYSGLINNFPKSSLFHPWQ